MMTPTERMRERTRARNRYRDEARHVGIASPYRQYVYIRSREAGMGIEAAIMEAGHDPERIDVGMLVRMRAGCPGEGSRATVVRITESALGEPCAIVKWAIGGGEGIVRLNEVETIGRRS